LAQNSKSHLATLARLCPLGSCELPLERCHCRLPQVLRHA